MDDNKWLTKIRAMLAKAEDPAATPEEAETYTARATELMGKYGIDQALIDAARPEKVVPGDLIINITGSYAVDKRDMLSGVAWDMGCRTILLTHRRRGFPTTHRVHVFGFASDIQRVEVLYTSLLVQMANGLAQSEVPYWENPAAYRRSWIAGFTDAVRKRIRESEQRAKQNAEQERPAGAPGVAVVLADRVALVEKAKADAYPDVKKARARTLSGSGAGDGYDVGQRADLGGTRINSSTRNAGALAS